VSRRPRTATFHVRAPVSPARWVTWRPVQLAARVVQELARVVGAQIRMTDVIVATVRKRRPRWRSAHHAIHELSDASKLIQRMSADITKVSDGAYVAVAAASAPRCPRSRQQGRRGGHRRMSTLRANSGRRQEDEELGDRSMRSPHRVDHQPDLRADNMLALNARDRGRVGGSICGRAKNGRQAGRAQTATATRDIGPAGQGRIHIETTETVTATSSRPRRGAGGPRRR